MTPIIITLVIAAAITAILFWPQENITGSDYQRNVVALNKGPRDVYGQKVKAIVNGRTTHLYRLQGQYYTLEGSLLENIDDIIFICVLSESCLFNINGEYCNDVTYFEGIDGTLYSKDGGEYVDSGAITLRTPELNHAIVEGNFAEPENSEIDVMFVPDLSESELNGPPTIPSPVYEAASETWDSVDSPSGEGNLDD